MIIVIDPAARTVDLAPPEGTRERLFSDCATEARLVPGSSRVAAVGLPLVSNLPWAGHSSFEGFVGSRGDYVRGPVLVAALDEAAPGGNRIASLEATPEGSEGWLNRIRETVRWLDGEGFEAWLGERDAAIMGAGSSGTGWRSTRLSPPGAVPERAMTGAEAVVVAAAGLLPLLGEGEHLETWVDRSDMPDGVRSVLTGLGFSHEANDWFTPEWVGNYERGGRSLVLHDGYPRAEGRIGGKAAEVLAYETLTWGDVGSLLQYGSADEPIFVALPHLAHNRSAAVEVMRSERVRAAGIRVVLVARDGTVAWLDPS